MMNNNRRPGFAAVALMAGFVLIVQLIYFWVSPKCVCRVVVYPSGTVLTLVNAALAILSYYRLGTRRCAAIAVTGTVLVIIGLGVSAACIAADASIRTAAFAQLAVWVVYLTAMVLLLALTEPDNLTGRRSFPAPTEYERAESGGRDRN